MYGPPFDELELRLRRARESAHSAQELVDALNELAWAVRKKDPQGSLDLATEARENAREFSYDIGLGWALRNSGHAHYRLAEYAAALAESLEALEIFERLGLDKGRTSAAGGVGMAYTRLANYSLGLRFHRESLRIRREMGDAAGEGASLNNLGVIHFELADYPVALEHYLASLEIWQRLKHRDGTGHAFNNFGEVHEKMGDLDRALECYDQAFQAFEEVSNGVNAVATRVNRGPRAIGALGAGGCPRRARALRRPSARGEVTDGTKPSVIPSWGGPSYRSGGQRRRNLTSTAVSRSWPSSDSGTLRRRRYCSWPGCDWTTPATTRRPSFCTARYGSLVRPDLTPSATAPIWRSPSSTSVGVGRGARSATTGSTTAGRKKVLGGEADRRLTSILIRAEAGQAEREAELHRLRHVELAEVVKRLKEADVEKARLLAELRLRAAGAREDGA